ncbi:MAG: hypothetical protein U5R14_03585 [Gemmatimonadota bacterium]|nr:hypothetical protein [Gemmatimonadota bacterium]
MNCREAREGLWPPERPRLLDPEIERAREHVRHCPECARYFQQDRAVLDSWHRLRGVRAPLRVRLHVFQALARARGEGGEVRIAEESTGAPTGEVGRSRARRWMAVAIVALIVVGSVSVVFGSTWSQERVASEPEPAAAGSEAAFVEDYLRRAVGEDYLETSDRAEIARFLRRELGLQSELLELSGLVPTRVEICLLEGRRGAMVVYRLDGERVTHYLVPKRAEDRPPRVAREHGALAVVTWASSTIEEALVGQVSPDTLLQLARDGVSE